MHHKVTHIPEVYNCPYCDSNSIIRRGKVKLIQRYTCKTCRRSFRATTATAIHHIHKKEMINKYLEALRLGLSVRKAASYVGISKNTSFVWRHKFLTTLATSPDPKENDIAIGAALLRMPYLDKSSQKTFEGTNAESQSLLLTGNKHIWLKKISCVHKTTDIARIITQCVDHSFIAAQPDRLLTRALKQQDVAKYVLQKAQNRELRQYVAKTNNEISNWMGKFRGVSSKYLQHYWSWFTYLKRTKRLKSADEEFDRLCLSLCDIH